MLDSQIIINDIINKIISKNYQLQCITIKIIEFKYLFKILHSNNVTKSIDLWLHVNSKRLAC